MDKETLSNYGWIVICVLVLAVMLALAGPFGTFVAGAVKSTTAGLFGVNQNALGAAGITIDGQDFADGGTGGTGDQGGTNTLPEVGKTAEEYTWAEIKAISDAGKADEYFDLGDTKTITLTDGTSVVMEIVAFNADEKADGSGTAAISWISKDLVAYRAMNSTNTNVGGWEASEMRSWLQGDFFNTLSDDIQKSIVKVNKSSSTQVGGYGSLSTCADSIWIPSYFELFGDDDYAEGSYIDTGTTYANYFVNNSSCIKKHGNVEASWWLRSTYGTSKFCVVNTAGESISGSSASMNLCVTLGFCF